MASYITGIQQCGIGVTDACEAAMYYKRLLGFDALVFDDVAEAKLMTRYTGNKIERRRALLTMNMQGGGGIELWQYLDRKPQAAPKELLPGMPGIYAIKIKTGDIEKALDFFVAEPDLDTSKLLINAVGEKCFWIKDKYHNRFQIVEATEFFATGTHVVGGVCGAVIGVTNMETAISFYKKILGEAVIVYVQQNAAIENNTTVKATLLRKKPATNGAFAGLLGSIDIELIQDVNADSEHIFENRFWGDLGYIHLCVDVLNTDAYKADLEKAGYPMTVDSKNFFAMGEAGGRFGYVEDPDGTLIELVETYKVPLLKKWGLYMHLKKQATKKPLPKWMVKMLGINKVNFKNQ